MFEMQILKSVVEQERIDIPFVDGEPAAFYPVLVHEHNHVLQIVREHVWLVAGCQRVEQQRFSIGYNPGRIGVAYAKPAQPASSARHAFVSATQNGDTTAARL